MALCKTERGRTALQAHSTSGLSLAERRVLILCDGRRYRDDIVALLGPDAVSMLERLLQEGYLALENTAPATPRLVTVAGTAVATPPPVAPQPAPMQAPRPAASRRSLAASRMYLVDILQLQRDPESVSLRADIQTSPSEDELVYRMMQGLRHLQAVASASYARRVGDRLAEMLPEPHLPRLDQARSAWLASVSAVA